MASEQNLPAWARGPYARSVGAVARGLAGIGVSANALTWLSLLPAALAGIAAAGGGFFAAACLILVGGLCDILDGALARATGTSSRFGALLDSSLDRLSDAAVPLGLVVLYAPFGATALVPALAMLSGYTVSYVRARAEGLGYALPRLWWRREDRMAVTVLALLLAPIGWPDLGVPAPLTLVLFGVLGVVGLVAAGHALAAARRLA